MHCLERTNAFPRAHILEMSETRNCEPAPISTYTIIMVPVAAASVAEPVLF